MQIITIYDYLLLPIYLYVFYFLIKRSSLKLADAELSKIFLIAFGLRMLGSIAYSLLVQYYYGYGDSFGYYEGGDFFIEQIQANFGNIKYLITSPSELQRIYSAEYGNTGDLNGLIATGSAVIIMKTSAIISILSFNKYLITSLFFALFSFAGQWKLFRVFNDINKGRHQKLLAFAVLYTPSIWFWGSGLIKESICLGGLGFIISILYNGFVKKRISPTNWVILICMIYLVYVIKSYIVIILFSTLFLTLIFTIFQKIKILIIRILVTLISLFIIFFSLSFYDLSDQVNSLAEESVSQIESFQKTYQLAQNEDERSAGGFEMANLSPSFSSMMLKAPVVVLSCLFRPFLWESSKKLIMFFSSLESTLLLLGTLLLIIKSRVWGVFKLILTNPYIFFCFIISVLFAAIIGFTTFNFGTLVRYKIMLLPFYYFMLVHIYIKLKERSK